MPTLRATVGQTTSDSFMRLLGLGRARATGLDGETLTLEALMSLSEAHLEHLARGADGPSVLVASRILDTPQEFSRWEGGHARLMRGVAGLSRRALQVRSLLSTSLALAHRKALFEYLRDRQVPTAGRQRLIGHFHGNNDYLQTLLAEHGNYLRSAASYLCTTHIGAKHLQVETFAEPLQSYVQLYTEYFRTYCDAVLASGDDVTTQHLQALLPYLKQEVLETRNQLLKRPVRR
jgi:hypothetical protein